MAADLFDPGSAMASPFALTLGAELQPQRETRDADSARHVLQGGASVDREELRRALVDPGAVDGRAADLLSRFLLAEVVNGVLGGGELDTLLLRLVALAAEALEAERGTIFLYDAEADELFARVAQGGATDEIRTPRTAGIAGAVFQSGEAESIADAYADRRFNPEVDRHTGYRTRSLICVPLRLAGGGIIGVIEILNKQSGPFDRGDLLLLQAIATQAATALDQAQRFEQQQREHSRDRSLFDLAQGLAAELRVDRLLEAIVEASPRILEAERATLFLYDRTVDQLWSRLTVGGGVETMRLPSTVGLAGAAFTTRQPVAVADAYADPRFYAGIDERSGFRTKSVLCVPIIDEASEALGVLEVLNKRRGQFGAADERRLCAFARQAAIALHNAQLFADVLSLKSYTDNVLRAVSDGVVTVDRDFNITKINDAARRILRLSAGEWLEGSALAQWGEANPWLEEALRYAADTGGSDYRPDVPFRIGDREVASVNATVAPLHNDDGSADGYTLVLQDISRQKKAHATVTRYMAKEFAERVLDSDGDMAARSSYVATILFSDIRHFTTIAEGLTAEATVDMLNEYFGEMAQPVLQQGGALDKYIGDGLMAVFGSPATAAAGAEGAVQAASQMVGRLAEVNRRRASRGLPHLEIGIGLASGDIVAGPVGACERTDFTVIGDSVNLAARLEGANKYYRTTILAAGDTVRHLAPRPLLRPIDVIRVQGKARPTEIFELLEHHDDESFPCLSEALALFEAGIGCYRARDWRRALGHFAAVLKIAPGDGPSWVYTDRCLYYREHPPPEHWDGVWAMQTK
jgi:adenylate cyclase